MGPKKPESKKAEKKLQEKIIEDKTFGLKNKNKSKVVQKFIKGVVQQVKGNVRSGADQKEHAAKQEQKKAREEQAFLDSLLRGVKDIKQEQPDEGKKYKDVLCAFFKAGLCDKGDNCQYSHDLNIEFNQGVVDIYTDLRDVRKEIGLDTEASKIAEEREAKRRKVPQTNIVCKFFLDAVQKKVYGWKWECPNGEDCHYKHCVPKDYVITNKNKIQEDMTIEEYMYLEETIDAERERVARTGTPVNDETFAAWKKKRGNVITKEKDDVVKKKIQTGVQLFKKQGEIFQDDDNADEEVYKNEYNQLEEETKRIAAELKGVEINTELFQGDENLDELVELDEDEVLQDDDDKERELVEEEKENGN